MTTVDYTTRPVNHFLQAAATIIFLKASLYSGSGQKAASFSVSKQ